MKYSPPNHAAARANSPKANPVQGRLVKYINTQTGAMARKTAPTRRTRKLEKLIIRSLVRRASVVNDYGLESRFRAYRGTFGCDVGRVPHPALLASPAYNHTRPPL